MDWKRLQSLLLAGSRIAGIMLLAAVLLAACGDDDDDEGDAGDIEATNTTEMTVPSDAGTEAEVDEPTPTEADMTGEGTESEADGSPTSDDVEMTGTEEDDMAGTATEDMDADGTATEDDSDSASGTATEDMTEGTATAADDDGTATEDVSDGTATEANEDDGTATADDSGAASGDTAELGEIVELDGFSISVEDAEEFAGVPGLFEADEGSTLLGVTVTLENSNAEDEMSVLRTLGSIHLETGDGERHDVDLMATAVLLINEQGIPEGQLEGGEQVTGQIGFQIPEDADEVLLVIESDNGEMVEIDLSGEL